jgi:hypothetical protein
MCMKALAGLFGGAKSKPAPALPPAQAVAPVDTSQAAKPDVAEVGSSDGPDQVSIGNTLSQNTRTKRAQVPGLGL